MTDERLKSFFLMLRQALLMVIRWIEKEYQIKPK